MVYFSARGGDWQPAQEDHPVGRGPRPGTDTAGGGHTEAGEHRKTIGCRKIHLFVSVVCSVQCFIVLLFFKSEFSKCMQWCF